MSRIGCYVVRASFCAGLILATLNQARAAKVLLHEAPREGVATEVTVELKADGLSRSGLPDRKPLALRVDTRVSFHERVLRAGTARTSVRVARRVIQAAAAINWEGRSTAVSLRPEVSLLVSELRDGSLFTYSPGGPLTRSELELVEAEGDPLTLPALLPEAEVQVGDHWKVDPLAARALSGYDALAASTLEATLEELDESIARFKLSGEVRGAVQGGEGVVTCTGTFRFDRKAGLIDRLSVTRTEKRQPGPIEAALDLKSTLTVDRHKIEPPRELTDDAVAALPAAPGAGLELLQYQSPAGKFTLLHDRAWYLFADDVRQTVWKRLDHGELVAQCNLAVGPNAGKGRHQDLGQFRDDIRRALGRRFERILEAAELDGPPDGGFRYRVAVAGHEGDVGVLWYYYLIASPEGDQLLVAFTLGAAQAKQFADQDLRLMGSLQWLPPAAAVVEPAKGP